MSDSSRPINLSSQLFTSTLPKYLFVIVVCCTATLGYTQVATTEYVDTKYTAADKRISALTDTQKVTTDQVKKLTESDEKTDKRMDLVVRLVAAQYMDHMDEEEATPVRRRNPRSTKAKQMAAALKIDPDDPLAGLELLDQD